MYNDLSNMDTALGFDLWKDKSDYGYYEWRNPISDLVVDATSNTTIEIKIMPYVDIVQHIEKCSQIYSSNFPDVYFVFALRGSK